MESGDLLDMIRSDEVVLPDPQFHHPPRTKLVFLYSDEDEDDRDLLHPLVGKSDGVAIVAAATPLNPPPAELDAMRDAAGRADHDQRCDSARAACAGVCDEPPLFSEDTVGVEEGEGGGTAPRCWVRVVEAPSLWEGVEAHSRCGSGGAAAAPLRHRLSARQAKQLLYARKRVRADGDFFDEEKDSAVENGAVAVADCLDVSDPRLVLDDDGLVCAVNVGGYQLTVDERQLQDCDGNSDTNERVVKKDDVGGGDVCCHILDGGDDSDCIFDDDGDIEDEEDEDDEELDEALVVAIVERLVSCCEDDELSDALRDAADIYLRKARFCLRRLHAGETSLAQFDAEMRDDILRLQRALQRAQRPKDAPIVIDGVLMDF